MNTQIHNHETTFAGLAIEHNLDPVDIACAERAFGNDFDLMQDALSNIEPTGLSASELLWGSDS